VRRLFAGSLLAALVASGAFSLDMVVGPRLLLGDYVGWGSDYGDTLDALDADPALRLGASIGVFAEMALPWWGLVARPEIAYTSGGSAYKQPGDFFGPAYNGDVKTSIVYKFIEVTPLVKKSFGQWNAFAGPDVLFAVGDWVAKLKAEDGDLQDALKAAGTDEVNISKSDFHKVYLGAVLGAGYPFSVGPGTLTVDLRAQFWFTNFDESNDVNAKQAAFVLGVSYGFPVKL
jgi:hypothetical protein